MDYYSATRNGFKVKDFDMRHTIESAQPLTFFADYNFNRKVIEYPSNGSMISASVNGSSRNAEVKLASSDMKAAMKDFETRFALKDDMKKIYKHIDTDEFVHASIMKYRGMRVTLNDPWETTLCFIMSQYNNVKRIRLIIKNFVSSFGPEILDSDGRVIGRGFPTSEDLTRFTEADFRRNGAGFRAKYIAVAADYCTNNLDLYKLGNKPYEKLKEELMGIMGVGDKVADCIALMGYRNMDAFPIDVWVKRTMEKIYFKGRKKKIEKLHEFAENRWDGYRGYAQQYIFHTGRNI